MEAGGWLSDRVILWEGERVGGLRRQLVGHEGEQTEERVQRTECVQSVWRSERSLAS